MSSGAAIQPRSRSIHVIRLCSRSALKPVISRMVLPAVGEDLELPSPTRWAHGSIGHPRDPRVGAEMARGSHLRVRRSEPSSSASAAWRRPRPPGDRAPAHPASSPTPACRHTRLAASCFRPSRPRASRPFPRSRADWTTQIGARRWTTASEAMVSAVCRAVPPVTHPPQLKPTIIVSTIEATQDQKSSVFVGRALTPPLSHTPLVSVRFHVLAPPMIATLVGLRRGAPGWVHPRFGP